MELQKLSFFKKNAAKSWEELKNWANIVIKNTNIIEKQSRECSVKQKVALIDSGEESFDGFDGESKNVNFEGEEEQGQNIHQYGQTNEQNWVNKQQ